MPKPTAQYIDELKTELQNTFRIRDTELDERRLLRLRLKDASEEIPEEYRVTSAEYRTAEIQSSGQTLSNVLVTADVIATIRPAKESQREATTKGERWLNWGVSELEAESAADPKVVDTQVFYGPGVYKLYPRPPEERWPDYPRRDPDESDDSFLRRSEDYKRGTSMSSVFYYGHVPLGTFYWREDNQGVSEAIEVKRLRLPDLYPWEKELGQAGISLTSEDGLVERVTVVEYWNRRWRAMYIDDGKQKKVFDTWEHGFGLVPYFIAAADQTSEPDPAYRHLPLLWPMYGEAAENNRLRTMFSNVAYFWGYPMAYVETVETGELVLDPESGAPKVISIRPGTPPQLGPGQKLARFGAETGADLRQAVLDSDLRLLRYAAPDILRAQSPGADFPGYGLQMLQRLGVARLDSAAKGRAQAKTQMYRFMLWAVKHYIMETVYATGYDAQDPLATAKREPLGLKPDDVVSLVVGVRVQPDLPTDRMALEKHGSDLLDGGKISRIEFHQDYRGKENPEEIIADISADQISMSLEQQVREIVLAVLTGADVASRLMVGENGEAIFRDIKDQRSGLGKGSPGQPRVPGVRMPTGAPPTGESPTFSGPLGPEPVPMGGPVI